MIIAIDFDGTCVTHDYPDIGKDIGAIPVLKELVENEHDLILNTMRDGDELEEAIAWFNKNNIPLYGINYNPEQKYWTTSPKIYAHLYIDDSALGVPLIYPEENKKRPYVDWVKVKALLKEKNFLK